MGRPVHASAEIEQNCGFDGAYAALEEQRPEWSAVRASIRTLATHGGRRCRVKSGKAADRSMVAEGDGMTVRSIGKQFPQCSDRSVAHRSTESAQGAKFAKHFVGCGFLS